MATRAGVGKLLGRLVGRRAESPPVRPDPPPSEVASPRAAAEGRPGRVPAETTRPAPPQYHWTQDIHAQQSADLPGTGRLDLVLVGDSLAQVWPLELWAPWRAFSLGVSGDRTQHILWRLDQLVWGTCRPDRILIVAGTNNLLADDAAGDIAAGIEAIAAELAEAQPAATLFVLLPPPFGPGLRGGAETKRALRERLAPRFGIRLIDADAPLAAAGLESNPNYQDDGVHFTERGYTVLTDTVRAACRPLAAPAGPQRPAPRPRTWLSALGRR